jgi:hypothetical protein
MEKLVKLRQRLRVIEPWSGAPIQTVMLHEIISELIECIQDISGESGSANNLYKIK